MISIADAAIRSGRDAETIRSGRLRANRENGRLYVHAEELEALIARPAFDLPQAWIPSRWGAPQPDWVGELRRARGGRKLGRRLQSSS